MGCLWVDGGGRVAFLPGFLSRLLAWVHLLFNCGKKKGTMVSQLVDLFRLFVVLHLLFDHSALIA